MSFSSMRTAMNNKTVCLEHVDHILFTRQEAEILEHRNRHGMIEFWLCMLVDVPIEPIK
jgi:hypothetical protein